MQQRVPFSVYISGGALVVGALSVALLPPVLVGGFPPWLVRVGFRLLGILPLGAITLGVLGVITNFFPSQRERWAWGMSVGAVCLGWLAWRMTHPTHPE